VLAGRHHPLVVADGTNVEILHAGVGRAHAGTRVLVLVKDLDVRVITKDRELLRHLTIDPTKDYQPIGRA
jgi:hypothetical protein